MSDSDPRRRTRQRVMVALWIIACVVALIGVVVAISTTSWWPLVLLLGLVVPMIPIGNARRSARD